MILCAAQTLCNEKLRKTCAIPILVLSSWEDVETVARICER
jgi:hypothetical protein